MNYIQNIFTTIQNQVFDPFSKSTISDDYIMTEITPSISPKVSNNISDLLNFPILLRCHPSELFLPCTADKVAYELQTSFIDRLQLINLQYGKTGYITYIKESANTTTITFTFYFVMNGAIGPLSGLFNKFYPILPSNIFLKTLWFIARLFDYHGNDSVDITIEFDNFTRNPIRVNYDAHSRGQGIWIDWKNVPKIKINGTSDAIVAYVALNSHSVYPKPQKYYRIFGLANDVCEHNGKEYLISDYVNLYNMDQDTSIDWNSIRSCALGIQLPPSQHSITPFERFFLPFFLKKISQL